MSCGIMWVSCILINVAIQLYYTIHKDGFLLRLFIGAFKFDYTAIADEMTPMHRILYLLTLIGMVVFFFPGGYFVGSILKNYL